MKRLFLADDHPLFREGLRGLIERNEERMVCGEAADGDAALSGITETTPDLVVSDLSLGRADGLELIDRIHRQHPTIPILVVSMHDEVVYALRALSAGARGYVMKREPPKVILEAIEQVLSGHVYLSAAMTARLVEHASSARTDTSSEFPVPLDALTDRELQVLQLIGEGRSTAEVARALSLSVKTIETYRTQLKRKLCLRTHTELVRYAVCWSERGDAPAE